MGGVVTAYCVDWAVSVSKDIYNKDRLVNMVVREISANMSSWEEGVKMPPLVFNCIKIYLGISDVNNLLSFI